MSGFDRIQVLQPSLVRGTRQLPAVQAMAHDDLGIRTEWMMNEGRFTQGQS